MKLDEKDAIILNALQENCRFSLTKIARKANLSIDSTKKRINKLIKGNAFHPRIILRPRNFGYPNVMDVRIKLKNTTKENVNQFIEYLKKHPRVTEIFEIAGEWDMAITIISKDAIDFGKVTEEIRYKFGKIISTWTESLTIKCFKFESYDMENLIKG
jgi:DNA-binding Lrp family transcriptional regulator